jgi:hypothetical protein
MNTKQPLIPPFIASKSLGRTNKTNTLFVLLTLMVSVLSSNLSARIISVTASNSTSQVTITRANQTRVSWSVVVEARETGQRSIRSIGGSFYTGLKQEILLGRTSVAQVQNRFLQEGATATYLFSESLNIPQSIVRQAQKQGYNQIVYVRQFDDLIDNTRGSNAVYFQITSGSAAGALSISRIQMAFDDERTSAILAPKEIMRANAIISYTGTGLLEYQWQIATPPSTKGQPVFRPLNSRKQYLLSADQIKLTSPELPSLISGEYLVRLKLDKPNPDFSMPTLRYAVNGSRTLHTINVTNIYLSTPTDNSQLSAKTRFKWQPVANASAYRLELYARPVRNSKQPSSLITGVVIPAEQTNTLIGDSSRSYLSSGNTYYWRVVALSEEKQLIAKSEFRSIRF